MQMFSVMFVGATHTCRGTDCNTARCKRWGYGSRHGGERYRIYLCEICFFQALAGLRQERRISRLFDDEQSADDLTFGRIAQDNFWGDW